MMADFRATPPAAILGSPVVRINDFQTLETLDTRSGARTPIEQDRSNVLQWFTEDGTTVSVRPSGTEPKIKFYFGVRSPGVGRGVRTHGGRPRRQDRGDQERPETRIIPPRDVSPRRRDALRASATRCGGPNHAEACGGPDI